MDTSKRQPTSVWLDQKSKDALTKVAEAEERSKSQVVRRAIVEYAEQNKER